MATSTWPDAFKQGLTSHGRRVHVANLGANCGTTAAAGVTAELVVWDPIATPVVTGNIVVFRPVPRPEVRAAFADSDDQSSTPFDSWPVEGRPVSQQPDATHSISSAVWAN